MNIEERISFVAFVVGEIFFFRLRRPAVIIQGHRPLATKMTEGHSGLEGEKERREAKDEIKII